MEPQICLFWQDELHIAVYVNSLQLNIILLDMKVYEIKTVLIKKTQIYVWNYI